MTKIRIDQAVEVIKYAIEHGISVKEASVKCGYSDTYVKNVKAQIIEQYEDGVVSKEDYDFFMSNYNLYLGSKQKDEISGDLDPDIKINLKKEKPLVGSQMKVEQKGDTMEVNWQGDSESFDETFNSEDEDDGTLPPDEEFDYQDDELGHLGYPPNHVKTLEQLLARTGVDMNEWEVIEHLVNKWDTTTYTKEDRPKPITWENFQVKARLKRVATQFEGKQAAELFKEIVSEYNPPAVHSVILPTKAPVNDEKNLLEVALYDLHIGKLAWAGETGENFDVKIAVNRFVGALEKLLARAKGFTYNRVLFPVGNDFFNTDNLHNTTTAGTPQDEDLRWQKTFKMGVQLIYTAIDMLKATGVPVDVLIIPGNHDFERSFYLGSVLEARYGMDDQVVIDNGASPRKYYEYGKVLLGLSHGKYEKENALPLLMATEQPEAWGRTMFHEWHLGHFHRKRNVKFAVFDKAQIVNEDVGVTVRYLSSLTGTEQWHHKRAFVGSHKAGEAFIWNDETGLIGHLNANFVDFDKEH